MLLSISLIALMLVGVGITLMLNEVYIPAQLSLLVTMGIMTSIFFAVKLLRKKKEVGKAAGRILIMANTLFIVMLLASLGYEYWRWEALISNATMMKVILVLLGVFALYLNMMYFRAEVSYKEKRGNQRCTR